MIAYCGGQKRGRAVRKWTPAETAGKAGWNRPERKKAGVNRKRCFLTKRTHPSIANTRLIVFHCAKRTHFSCHLTPNELPKQAKTAPIARNRTRILGPQDLGGRPSERGATQAAQHEKNSYPTYDSLPGSGCFSYFSPRNSSSPKWPWLFRAAAGRVANPGAGWRGRAVLSCRQSPRSEPGFGGL